MPARTTSARRQRPSLFAAVWILLSFALAACSTVETVSTTLRPGELRGAIASPGPLLPANLNHPALPPEPFQPALERGLRTTSLRSLPVPAGRLNAYTSPAQAAAVGRLLGADYILLPLLQHHGVFISNRIDYDGWGGPWNSYGPYGQYGYDPLGFDSHYEASTRTSREVWMTLSLVRVADAQIVWQGRARSTLSNEFTNSSWWMPPPLPGAPPPPPPVASFIQIAEDTAEELREFAP